MYGVAPPFVRSVGGVTVNPGASLVAYVVSFPDKNVGSSDDDGAWVRCRSSESPRDRTIGLAHLQLNLSDASIGG